MKKISFILALLISANGANAATRATARISPIDAVNAVMAPGENATTETVQSARAARRAPSSRASSQIIQPSSTQQITTQQPTRGVATRGITSSAATNNLVGRSALPAVSARAAKQNVISAGTKVVAATQNTVVDEECWNGFMGCMDSFCMLDNANGGRCICSDKNAEYDAILEEIQKLDEQSYQLATFGVEQIEMGNAADAVMARTKDVTKSVEKDTKDAQSKRKSLDLSQWNSTESIDFDADVEDIFSLSSDGISINNKTGDALFRASAKLCHAQLPNCANQSTMMELMYKQRVRSDCTAYENSLRQQRTQSAQKLYAAQSAMREAALEQYQNANKYDLGQCTIQFKQCMQTTGGCGEDFTGCVGIAARAEAARGAENTGKASKQKTISGLSSKITIAASTYDTLLAKQPLCMTVTEQCVNVRDQVWDTFIREVAPQLKSAELIAESDLRSSCISNISNCFQKACRDTMDPDDPDGSYDLCLTRPQALESLCRVEIEPCKLAEPKIMDYVVARLASMRVDSCTREFKQCLISEDRCGSDYSQCVGLTTGQIVELCPAEKLVGCQYDYEGDNPMYSYDQNGEATPKQKVRSDKEIREELYKIAQGILLSIDNSMLAACQKIIQSKVIEVCGDLSYCDAFDDDGVIGTDSLLSYQDANGATVISGLMNFGLLRPVASGTDIDVTNYSVIYDDKGQVKADVAESTVKQRILAAIKTVKNKVDQKIEIIKSDEKVRQCIGDRGDRWKGGKKEQQDTGGRFPNLLKSYNLMIADSGLEKAYMNYAAKYDELVAEALKNQSDDIKTLACSAAAYDENSISCDEDNNCTTAGALGNAIENLYVTDKAGLSDDGLEYVINTIDLKKKLDIMAKGKSKLLVVDPEWNVAVNVITRTGVYSPGSNICTITMTTSTCANMEEIVVTTESDFEKDERDANGNGTYWCDDCEKEFNGVMCSKYTNPEKEVFEIRM